MRYLLELKCNLISLGLLDKNGFQFQSNNGMLIVSKGFDIVMKGRMRNSLYILEGNIINGETSLITNGHDKSRLWQLRMGHVGEKGLKELSRQNLLCGDTIQKVEFCQESALGKSKRLRFTTGMHTTQKPLDYVHSDL